MKQEKQTTIITQHIVAKVEPKRREVQELLDSVRQQVHWVPVEDRHTTQVVVAEVTTAVVQDITAVAAAVARATRTTKLQGLPIPKDLKQEMEWLLFHGTVSVVLLSPWQFQLP